MGEDGHGGKTARIESFIEDSQRVACSRPWGKMLWSLGVQKTQLSKMKSKLVNAHAKLVTHEIPIEVNPAFLESKTPGRVFTLKEIYNRSSQIAKSQLETVPKAKSPDRDPYGDETRAQVEKESESPFQPARNSEAQAQSAARVPGQEYSYDETQHRQPVQVVGLRVKLSSIPCIFEYA